MTLDRSFHELRESAREANARGDVAEARQLYLQAIEHPAGTRPEEFSAAVRELRELFWRPAEARIALTLEWYAGTERSQLAFLEKVPPIDRARTLLAWAERETDPARARERFARAADEYEAAGLVARAAIAREKGEDYGRARALWSRLSQVLTATTSEAYAAALARFNLARNALRTNDAAAAREAFVASVHLLEQAADHYETVGNRERAFDCYQMLIAIGRESGEFEHVLEGFVNAIRILREDQLRYFALQSYEEAIALAERQGEVSAAATLAREMAAYARKQDLPEVAMFGTLAQARLWQEVAIASRKRGAPAEIAENALLAAIIALGEAGQYRTVADVYGSLAALPLEQARKAHYERARARYRDASNGRVSATPLPSRFRQESAAPEAWHVDLIEWEQRGSAAEACADVLLDPEPGADSLRRKAMLARITALTVEAAGGAAAPAALRIRLAGHLGTIQVYPMLSPLEALYAQPETAVRIAVVTALEAFLFKRSFTTVRDALGCDDAALVEVAAKTVQELRFAHGFDPLMRIYREASNPRVRNAVVFAIAHINTVEAAEALLAVIEHDGDAERAAAVSAMSKANGRTFLPLARDSLGRLVGPARTAVRQILEERDMLAPG